MNYQTEQLEKTIKYLDGELSDVEKKAFEEEISKNAELQNTVNLVAEMDNILRDEDLVAFVKKLNALQKEKQSAISFNNLKLVFLSNKKIAVAASFIVVAFLSIFFFLETKQPLNESLYSQYYKPYDASIITRSDNSKTSNLIEAIKLYDTKKYVKAIELFNLVLKSEPNNTSAIFFIALSYMEINAFNKAIENLNKIISNNETIFIEQAEWYLALCYLKTNKITQAKKIIYQIMASNSYYRPNATDLANNLK